MSRVIVDNPAPYITRLMINRPEAKNAVDATTRHELLQALQDILADENTHALILCGAQGMFCAGGDLVSMADMTEPEARARMQNGHELVSLLWNAEIPVISAVEKYAIGAGAGLALLSDYIIAGEKAFFSFPFLNIGLVPDWGSTQMLIRRAGWSKTNQLILNKSRPKGQELLELGIADMVVADSGVMQTAIYKAGHFAKFPRLAFRLFKQRMRAYPESFEQALRAEENDQTNCFMSAEFAEGLAAILEKRSPDFIPVKNNPNG